MEQVLHGKRGIRAFKIRAFFVVVFLQESWSLVFPSSENPACCLHSLSLLLCSKGYEVFNRTKTKGQSKKSSEIKMSLKIKVQHETSSWHRTAACPGRLWVHTLFWPGVVGTRARYWDPGDTGGILWSSAGNWEYLGIPAVFSWELWSSWCCDVEKALLSNSDLSSMTLLQGWPGLGGFLRLSA